MTYDDLGFRVLNHRFWGIKLTEDLKKACEGYHGAEKADSAILYGYIDHKEGFSFAIIAVGMFSGNGIIADTEPNDNVHSVIRAEEISDIDLMGMEDYEEILSTFHANKLEMIRSDDVSNEIAETREMDFLDECRDPYYIDVIKVLMVKEGRGREVCWATIEGTTESAIKVALKNEPDQDLGVHEGDQILVNVYTSDDERIICYCNLDE